jgi:hypothetical protein
MHARVHQHLHYQTESDQGSQAMKSQRAVALTLPSAGHVSAQAA